MNAVLNRITSILLWSTSLAIIATIAYFSNAGLDITDESMYILDLLYPNASNPLRKGNVLVSLMFSWMDVDIRFYRILRLALTTGAALFFGLQLKQWMSIHIVTRFHSEKYHLSVAYVLTGALTSYALFPHTFSYNSLGLILTLFAGGFLLKHASNGSVKALLFAGAFIGIQVLNKFPSGLLMLVITAMVIFLSAIQSKDTPSYQWRALIALFIGFTALQLLIHLVAVDLVNWLREMKKFTSLDQAHPIGETLNYYKSTSLLIAESSLKRGWYVYVAIILAMVSSLPRFASLNIKIKNTLMVLPAFLACFWIVDQKFYLNGMPYMANVSGYFFFISLLSLMVVVQAGFEKKRQLFVVLGLCWLAPWLISMGTNSIIFKHMQQYVVFWLAILVISMEGASQHSSMAFLKFLLPVMTLTLAVQSYTGHTIYPYRLSAPLYQMRSEVITPSGATLLTDQEGLQMQLALKRVKLHLQDKDKSCLIALYKLPGLNYLGHLAPVGSGWYAQGADQVHAHYVEGLAEDTKQIILCIDSGESPSGILQQALESKGFEWHEFELIDSLHRATEKKLIYFYLGSKQVVKQ